ncbi:MAG: hypothetical protein NTY68_04480, partial [Candidatus Micrarchaeota archaeon]|nr:hypothetical protein [Candidatus Micrarchaeota archaeon]
MINDIIKVYGIYIILIVALAGISILLFDSNSPISLFGDKGTVSKCSPDDPSCVPGTSSLSTSGKNSKNLGSYGIEGLSGFGTPTL